MKNKKISTFFGKEGTQGWLMILPNALGLLIFYLIPIVCSVVLAFYKWDGLSKLKYVGFANFQTLLTDQTFIYSLRNTLYYSLMVVPAIIILVLIFGVALANDEIFGVEKLRTLYFLPLMTMPVLLNNFLSIFNIPSVSWISDPNFVLISVAMIGIWTAVAYDLIIVISGIKGISPVYYEAAKIDGASKTRQFFSITLPLLTPTLFFIVITQLIGCFQVFDSVSIILGGDAPPAALKNATTTVVLSIYQNGFSYFKMGYASSQSFVLFLIILIITAAQFKLQKKWVHYA